MAGRAEKLKKNWGVVLIACLLAILFFQLVFSQTINSNFSKYILQQRKNSIKKMVQLSHNTIKPVIDQVKTGKVDRREALKAISDLVREMTYEDEFGVNYIFMSSYDGKMLVQPFEPNKEGTSQWDLMDAKGVYIIRELVKSAKNYPEGSFVSYHYYLPGKDKIEEKLSYVIGIPEIDAYIGTGMYVESTYYELEEVLELQRDGSLALTVFILIASMLYARELLKSNNLLTREIKERIYAENNIRTIFDTIHDAILIHDSDGKVLHANKGACLLYGLSPEEIGGYTIMDLSYNEQLALEKLKEVSEQLEVKDALVFEWQCRFPHNDTFFYADVALKKSSWSGRNVIVAAVRDISDRKSAEAEIRQLAYFDYLTGLPNRVYIVNELEDKLNKDSSCGAVLFIDLDNFKFINDTFGHSSGDRVLVEISKKLQTLAEDKLTVSRIGGDEFVIVRYNCTDKALIEMLAVKLIELFADPINVDDNQFSVTCSIGIALFHTDSATVEELFKSADLAMYKAKNSGKNRYVFYDHSMWLNLAERIEMEQLLREAFLKDEFELYYQPQIRVADKTIVGLEALIRWNSPNLGLVSPAKFIPIAVEMGLINELGKWVIKKSFEFASRIQDKNLCISCNVSPVQLLQSSFVEDVIEIYENFALKKGSVALEITESSLVESLGEVTDKLTALRRKGILIYLDDFGTGYSSLTYLKKLPIDVVKIDKLFIDDIEGSGMEKQIVITIISLAKQLGLEVVAEGVETAGQLEKLAACNCNSVQGFLFSKPVPEAQVMGMLEN